MSHIFLPCHPTDNLDWASVLEQIPQSTPLIWEFELGLSSSYFPIEDDLHFSSLKLALTHFSKEVWPAFSERTESAILYRGRADFASFFLWTENQEENWLRWKQTRPSASEAHLRRLFCADAFVYYFRMLSHALPDELPLMLHFDTEGCGSRAELRQLLSRERFEHFHVEREEIATASLGICMPEEIHCSGAILAKLDLLLEALQEPYRVIEEPFLTELWEGIDRLYVFSEAVTVQGRRKLMGFCAAGGQVIIEGNSLGLPNELPAEKPRGRGI